MCPKSYVVTALVIRRSWPQISESRYQTELATGDDILAGSQCIRLGQAQLIRLLAIIATIEEVCASQNGLGTILGDMSIVGSRILLRIGIGRNVLNGILQISEHQTIYRVWNSLGNHITGGMFQQRDILPEAKHIKIAQGTKGMSLTQIGVLCILIIPGNAFTLIDKLIAAEDGCIIALPQGFVHIGIRWCLIHIETVEDLGIASIVVTRTAKTLVTHRLGQLIDGERRTV